MKNFVAVTVLALMTFAFSATTYAQKGQTRIKFARGTTEKTVQGTLSSWKSKRTFVIRVRAGQTLTTNNSGDNSITISVTPPKGSSYEQDMAADCHDRNEVDPTAAGDYIITVTECKKADPWKGKFEFLITVR
ncbi:MAG TPA: hypothetical protein PLR83_03975 [Pyrinomonadaceae bacterium]|nr:hypothetical protein [Pyrinomonadaceae bacterium]